jgi:hypothetical protein
MSFQQLLEQGNPQLHEFLLPNGADAVKLLTDAEAHIDCESREFFLGKTCAEAGYEDELCGACEWLAAYAELDRRAAQ